MTLERHRRHWEELASLDPLWAVLSYRSKKFGRWDCDEFLATGDEQVSHHLAHAAAFGYPQRSRSALDFGCGVGRLAPALSNRCDTYHGVDIAPRMVDQARALHAHRPNCTFSVNHDLTLGQLADESFDVVMTLYVLQHLTSRGAILTYVGHLVRVLREGGVLVFQLPACIPAPEKLVYDTRRFLWLGLRAAGVPSSTLHRRLGLSPMAMNHVPEVEVVDALVMSGATVVDVTRERGGMAIHDRTYYVTRRAP